MYRGKRIGNVYATHWTGAPSTADLDGVMRDAREGCAAAGPLVCLTIITEETEFPNPYILLQMVTRTKELSQFQRSAHFIYLRSRATQVRHNLRTSRFQSIVTQFILAGGGRNMDDRNDGVGAALAKAQKQGPLTVPPEEVIRQLKADGFPVE